MTDTAKRLTEIRMRHDGESASHDDVSWLLDVIAERDAEIAKLEAAMRELADAPRR